jgi:hypothetical protein
MIYSVYLRTIIFLSVGLLVIGNQTAIAQQIPGQSSETTRQMPDFGVDKNDAKGDSGGRPGHSNIEIGLSLGVLVFGAIIIGLQVLVMLKRSMYWEIWSFKIMGLTLVLVSGLFLIVAGYSQDQTAPMMGLLGTVAGYLLGKEANGTPTSGPSLGTPEGKAGS